MSDKEKITGTPVVFDELAEGEDIDLTSTAQNIDILKDVAMVVTVELGRVNKSVKDILRLSKGSVIELNKMAGEPVDIMVNGHLIAKGEVVVIDEHFGIRLTSLLSAKERIDRLP